MINNIGSVYKITSPSSKVYIGSSKDPTCIKRWISYKNLSCKSQIKLYKSLLKYTPKAHTFEILWTGSINELFEKEVYFGSLFNVLDKNKGLNLRLPRAGELCSYTSEETKQRMSKSLKGRIKTPEHILAMSLCRLGHKVSEDTKLKISNSRKGQNLSKKHKDLISLNTKTKISIEQYSLTGILLNTFSSLSEASIKTGTILTGLSKCINKKQKVCNSYIWKELGPDMVRKL